MKYTLNTSPGGKPAIYCERGIVCQFEAGYQQAREQDAAFIVRACNAHDELVDLLGRALSYVTETGSLDRMGNFVHDDTPSNRLCEKIRAALAKAKGER